MGQDLDATVLDKVSEFPDALAWERTGPGVMTLDLCANGPSTLCSLGRYS